MADDFFSSAWYRVSGLRPRLREHAQIHRHRYRGEPWYVLQDRSSRRVHRFTPAAYLLLGLMDGQRTLQEIWEVALDRLGDDAPTQDEVIRLIGQLHAVDMVQCDVPPDAAELLERGRRMAKTGWIGSLRSPLFIRLPLWDPDAFLERTVRFVGPLFSVPGLVLWLALVLPAMVVVGVQWEALTSNLADRVLSTGNLVALWVAFPFVKALHELGHAYATKSRGGEVHEMGLMLLVFSPIPYVDSSSANAFRSKTERALVGAAGMLVETAIAAVATFVWVLVEPGLVRAICFNVMLIAGLSTIVFNINPLLRYDGYYILADLIEVPNLALRSKQWWKHWFETRVFRVRDPEQIRLAAGERGWLIGFAPLSTLYRLFVILSIALFVASKFFIVGVVLALWALFSALLWPLVAATGWLLAGPSLRERRVRSVSVALTAVAAVGVLLFVLPAPNRTVTEGVVWVPEDAQVRARAAGFVQALLRAPGDQVVVGDELLRSEEPALIAQAAMIQARIDELQTQLAGEMFTDRVRAELTRRALQAELAVRERVADELARLVTRSGAAGTLVIPRAQDLPGRYLQKGEVVGYVTQERNRLVRLIVPQEDIDLMRGRLQAVQVRVAPALDRVLGARLVREVPGGQDRLPSRVLGEAGGGQVAADPRDPAGNRTFGRLFQFDVEVEGEVPPLPLGSRAFVRLEYAAEPLGLQAWRRVRQLFLSRFDV